MDSVYLNKKWFFNLMFIGVGVLFLAKLLYIQIISDEYKLLSVNNSRREIIEYPSRGYIYDRNGKLLVYNEAAYDLVVMPYQVENIDTNDLCSIIGISKEEFIDKISKLKSQQFSKYRPSVFEKQLSSETYAKLQEKLFKFSGFYVQDRIIRKYSYKMASHVLGYIGEVDDRIIAKNGYYKQGDYIGIGGIEKSYEEYLRGKRGTKIVMVDVFNREKGSFEDGKYDTAAVSGKNIITTLSYELQALGEKLMQNKKGSIVAIEPKTGEILVLITSPSYDPNLLVGRERSKNYKLLSSDTLQPLFDRALMAKYPPGSTFKLVNALIGVQEGVLNKNTTYYCNNGFNFGGLNVGCHSHPSPLNLPQSIQISCNAYYCNAFRAILNNPKFKTSREGYINWRRHVLSLNFGKKLRSDLTNELEGFIPPPEYYDKYYGKNGWSSLTVISLAIGQGEIGVSPLQLANFVSIIANRGYYYIPHVVKKIGNEKLNDPKYTTKLYTTISSENFENIIEGMRLAVEGGAGSTARIAKLDSIIICGKTGTAQNPKGEDHSIFIAFAPKDDPKIAISVIIENAGFGATWAAPIASLLIEQYLTDTIKRPELVERMVNGNLLDGSYFKKKKK